jgi:hypothetical protein
MHNNYGDGRHTTCGQKRLMSTVPFGRGYGVSCRNAHDEWQAENFFSTSIYLAKIASMIGKRNIDIPHWRNKTFCCDRPGTSFEYLVLDMVFPIKELMKSGTMIIYIIAIHI